MRFVNFLLHVTVAVFAGCVKVSSSQQAEIISATVNAVNSYEAASPLERDVSRNLRIAGKDDGETDGLAAADEERNTWRTTLDDLFSPLLQHIKALLTRTHEHTYDENFAKVLKKAVNDDEIANAHYEALMKEPWDKNGVWKAIKGDGKGSTTERYEAYSKLIQAQIYDSIERFYGKQQHTVLQELINKMNTSPLVKIYAGMYAKGSPEYRADLKKAILNDNDRFSLNGEEAIELMEKFAGYAFYVRQVQKRAVPKPADER
ncbi:unnamed protein product [Peronospora belbahrii]|uniref:RxLR effector protein n=1 Tax=Peronospora belbahrii TaxID=622444 RepID=A0ABN8CLI7_9STRA|nr:unnamed protein product [Peronospora belbahrii]